MTTENDPVVRACADLAAGDEIEARRDGRLVHRGRVTGLVPALELFWILDARTGTRRLLDVEALDIVRRPRAAISDRPDAEPTAT